MLVVTFSTECHQGKGVFRGFCGPSWATGRAAWMPKDSPSVSLFADTRLYGGWLTQTGCRVHTREHPCKHPEWLLLGSCLGLTLPHP
ncbi:hypothetical protein BaRGS_00004954 [Batillaria attramentaria]|uniref:Uncharacterized protein n=1 Tax=Batillaria attramentaria TaxID=370345 RepID=A0ABD0LWC9_9CAEN